jgi:hypothetical protein
MLKTFSIKFNHFEGVIPECIGSMVLLEWLDLGHNELSGELPIGICDLISLTFLWINDNSIEGKKKSLLTQRPNTRMHWSSHNTGSSRCFKQQNERNGT